MPGQRRQKQLWLWLLHWAEEGLLKSRDRKSVSVKGLCFHSSRPLVVAAPERLTCTGGRRGRSLS